MRALEILQESKKIDEAPPSALGQVGRRVGAAALGALGLKNTAAGIRGKADLIAKSREYYAAYKKFLGRIGKSEEDADLSDLRDFYIKNGLPASDVPTSGPADQDTVFDILKKTATGEYRGSSSNSAGSSNTVGGNAAQQTMSLKQIQSAVDALSDNEKNQLLQYLQKPATANASSNTGNPSQVRQAKQAKAAKVAQAQMASNTPKGRRRKMGSAGAANIAV